MIYTDTDCSGIPVFAEYLDGQCIDDSFFDVQHCGASSLGPSRAPTESPYVETDTSGVEMKHVVNVFSVTMIGLWLIYLYNIM